MSYRWTIETTQKLQDYIASGRTYPEAAALLNEEFGTGYNGSSAQKRMGRLKECPIISDVHWPEAMKTRLGDLYALACALSYKDLTDKLNAEFSTTYSRCAVIAQTKRMGLMGKKPASSANRIYTSRLRIVSANSNSNAKRVFKSAVTEPVALRCVEITPLNLTLQELETNSCRYIAGDDYLYCGHPQKPGRSYCPAHDAICYEPTNTPARPLRKYFGTDFARRA